MKDKYRRTELSLSFLLHQLYGIKDYVNIKSSHTQVSAKKSYLKIIKSIRFAIEETIEVTDKNHKTQLNDTIVEYEKLLKTTKTFDELDQLENVLVAQCENLMASKDVVSRATCFYWWKNAFIEVN